MSDRRPPHDCPVCGETLALTGDERELLRVFLASRGNMKELQNYLKVSYPTARLRFDALLARLGLDKGAAPPPGPSGDRVEILQALARGDIVFGEAEQRLQR